MDGLARGHLRLRADARRDRASGWIRAGACSTVPFVAFIAGFGWACFGIMIAGLMKGIENFSYVDQRRADADDADRRHVLPASGLPEWAQVLGNFNPLHHCVELVRHAAFGWDLAADLLHLGALRVVRRS